MLSRQDKRGISHNAYIVDHCYQLMSLVLGEPYLKNGILHYWDGEILTINGYPLNGVNENTEKSIEQVMISWLSTSYINAIAYFGPLKLNINDLISIGFTEKNYIEPDPFVVDMAIDLSQKPTKLARRDSRRASERGIFVKVSKLDTLSHEHIQIIREFMRNHEVDSLNRALIANLNAYLRDPKTYVFEARQGDTILGFATLSLNFYNRPMLTLAFYRSRGSLASDAIMNYVCEFCKERGYKMLGIGFSEGEGTYNFKRKWGAVETSSPFNSVMYVRTNTEFPLDLVGWSSRYVLPGVVQPQV